MNRCILAIGLGLASILAIGAVRRVCSVVSGDEVVESGHFDESPMGQCDCPLVTQGTSVR